MKISVSLPEEDVEFLDEYAKRVGIDSRSGVMQRAIRLLRSTGLGPAYSAAFEECDAEGEAEAWDSVVADGIESLRE